MPVFQPGRDVVPDNVKEIKCSRCAKVIVVATILTFIDLAFIISTSFVYLKEYYVTVRHHYDNETDTYAIGKPFVILYTWESIGALMILLWIVAFAIWLLVNAVCDD